jgi:ATP-dependent helicase/nuclease subunit B
MGHIYTVPFGQCFLKTLAGALKEGTLLNAAPQAVPFNTASMHVWLPTNRSVLGLKESFKMALVPHNTQPTTPFVLPLMHAFTDLELKNPFMLKEIHDLPKAIGAFERLALMMDFLPKGLPVKKAFAVAQHLIRLHDECIIGDISVASLESLYGDSVLESAPEHVQDAFLNLEILTQHMPKALAKRGLVIESWRRQQAMRYLADYITCFPPSHPIVIAGTTGTVPATRMLLKAVYNLPNGVIVLPGLDGDEDKTRVQAMRSHPQHTLFDLCTYLAVEPMTITLLSDASTPLEVARYRDTQCLFKAPPLHQKKKPEDYDPILIECASQSEEARVITAIVREKLFETSYSIAIVTPSQSLMRRLKAELSLYGIIPNDSAGTPLYDTPVGHFLKGLADFLKAPSAATFIHLSKHPLCAKNNRSAHLSFIRRYECLLRKKQQNWDSDEKVLWVNTLQKWLGKRTECVHFTDFIHFFKEAAEKLSDGAVFKNTDGESAAAFFTSLSNTHPFIKSDFEEAIILLMEMAAPVHDAAGLGSRVRILGTLEARLNTADVIICGSLNEGNWPKTPESDPLLSDGFRVAVGLPSKKRQQGLAAHDFCTSFYASHLYVTRALRDGGESMLESRLWTRLTHYYGGYDKTYQRIAHYLRPSTATPHLPPAPTPRRESRPKDYYASHVELLMRDPYAFYVRYILGISPLPLLDEALSAKDKGQAFHAILDKYLTHVSDPTEEKLIAFAKPYFETLGARGGGIAQTFWWYRFKRVAQWWHAKLDVELASLRQTEVSGEASFIVKGTKITLKSRADRLEVPYVNAHEIPILRIIDYKTGTLPTRKSIQNGTSPQLLVEAIIAHNQGFGAKFSAQYPLFNLEYWRLTGGDPAGECLSVSLDADERVAVQSAMLGVLEYFMQDQNPYLSSGIGVDARYLARSEEWESMQRRDRHRPV